MLLLGLIAIQILVVFCSVSKYGGTFAPRAAAILDVSPVTNWIKLLGKSTLRNTIKLTNQVISNNYQVNDECIYISFVLQI